MFRRSLSVLHGYAKASGRQASKGMTTAASVTSAGRVAANVRRIAWRLVGDTRRAVARPKAGVTGEFEIPAGSCTGPLLATLPLAPAVRDGGQSELNASVSASKPEDARNLCIFAAGDPRDGQWVLARVAFSK